MQNRRRFLKNVSAAAVAGLILPKNLLAMNKDKVIGIQLYTIRSMVDEDLEGSLKIVSDIGYKSVEAAGYADRKFYNMLPREFKSLVESHGLMPLSTHSKVTTSNADEAIEDAYEAGMKYLVLPWLPEEVRRSVDDYKKLAEQFNKIGEKSSKAGLTFGYHNHAFEFEKMDGVIPYNVLLDNTEPDLVTMQLDLYWIVYGGFRPVDYFKNYPGRFKLWHVKDMDKNNDKETAEAGQGIINFQSIFRKKDLAGMEYCFVEQEHFKSDDMVQSIKTSFNFLENLSDY